MHSMLSMAQDEVRYDRAADWYVGFARQWAAEPRPFLPGDLSGKRVLDVGCGLGELSRLVAGRGASVTALDLSPLMLGLAASHVAD